MKRGLKGYPWRASDHTQIGYRLAGQSTVILVLELPTSRSVRVNRHSISNIDSKTLEAFRVSRPWRFFRVARIRIFGINCWHINHTYLALLGIYLTPHYSVSSISQGQSFLSSEIKSCIQYFNLNARVRFHIYPIIVVNITNCWQVSKL